VVNLSSNKHKRLIRDDHSVAIRSYAQGYPLGLGMEGKATTNFGRSFGETTIRMTVVAGRITFDAGKK
jgi:hypothetical protein